MFDITSILGMVTDEKETSVRAMAEEEVHRGVEASVQPDEQRVLSRLSSETCGVSTCPGTGQKNAPLCCSGQMGVPGGGIRDAAIFLPLHAPLLSAVNKRIVK